MGPGGFFPANLDLADILGRTDFDLRMFIFLDFLLWLWQGICLSRIEKRQDFEHFATYKVKSFQGLG